MKALSLWQPWASLMADGRKTIETRHWPAPKSLLGQNIAIHAAKHFDRYGWDLSKALGYEPSSIPRGYVVAIVRLERCLLFGENAKTLAGAEAKYGNFETGRYGWYCALAEKLDPPIAACGRQGLWNWERR